VLELSVDLPRPAPAAAAHSAHLVELIRQAIAASPTASMSFAQYMELALYAPGLGYYSASLSKLGPAGDFVTAPEISPLFGRCIARQCSRILAELRGGEILELGAGSGRLAADLLLEMERLKSLPERYSILDTSADLQARQQTHLHASVPHLCSMIRWLDSLPEDRFTGIILANEVVDALPVHRFCITDQGIEELRVGNGQAGRFIWIKEPATEPELIERVESIQSALDIPLSIPYLSELNLLLGPWIASLTERLERGLLLFIDYGYPRREYYHPERRMGTLICHYRQRAHPDPLILTGLQDITAFVDFTAVAEAASRCGLEVAGYTSQAHFLIASDLDKLLLELQSQEPNHYLDYARQAKLLTLPGEMGERFKIMALTKDWHLPLHGLQRFDQRGRL
jgi:SAM-dependent MidA family methyltransferase